MTQNIALTDREKRMYSAWLEHAGDVASRYSGSEEDYDSLLEPLILMEDFVRAKLHTPSTGELERAFAHAAQGDRPKGRPSTVAEFMVKALNFYKVQENQGLDAFLAVLERGGAYIERSPHVFVQTNKEQKIQPASALSPAAFEFKEQPRLSLLLEHLQGLGIYSDDVLIRVGQADKTMVRKLPYILVQIPRMDKEIALCNEVGEATFVSSRILGPAVWAHLDKEQLQARPEIRRVVFGGEAQWWGDIAHALTGDGAPLAKKQNVRAFAGKKPNLDMGLIKDSIWAHYEKTKKWPTRANGDVLYGAYAGQEVWMNIYAALYVGGRGLPGGGSLTKVVREVKAEYARQQASPGADAPALPEI
jgi:hypothetical protein